MPGQLRQQRPAHALHREGEARVLRYGEVPAAHDPPEEVLLVLRLHALPERFDVHAAVAEPGRHGRHVVRVRRRAQQHHLQFCDPHNASVFSKARRISASSLSSCPFT